MMFDIPAGIQDSLFRALGTSEKVLIARAPGRINLIGEHTDYNNGLVLPGAIDKYTYFACKPNGTDTISATAIDFNESISIPLDQLEKSDNLWTNFLIGLLLEFQKREINLVGFDCAFTSEVPIGAGMSSSSALECAILVGLQELLAARDLTKWDLINMSQSSNHNFLGIKGGIMDQFASLFGQENQVMLLDCSSSDHEYVSLINDEYSWLLINSCVKHNHLTSGYNDRVQECQQAVEEIQSKFPDVAQLSDLTSTAQLSSVSFSSPTIKQRACFVLEENQRVRAFVRALAEHDLDTCGQLLYASHKGLAEDYEVSCDELNFLVQLLRGRAGVLGSRMMGGGFGGCTINLIHNREIRAIKKEVTEQYKEAFDIDPLFYEVNIAEGASCAIFYDLSD